MKIEYVGHKKLVTVTLPVGAKKKFIKSRVDFVPGVPVEIADEDAEKILIANGKSGNYRAVEGKFDAEPEVLEEKQTKSKIGSKKKA